MTTKTNESTLESLDTDSLDTVTGAWGGYRHYRRHMWRYGGGYPPPGYSMGWGYGGPWMAYNGPGFSIRMY
jgi:hypothetical protein